MKTDNRGNREFKRLPLYIFALFFHTDIMAGNFCRHDKQQRRQIWKGEEKQEKEDQIKESGQIILEHNSQKHKIYLLSIIGEIEGHDIASGQTKTTKYEHVLPMLAAVEDSRDIDGVLVLLNTVGGDVEAGLAIAEMIASLSKPTVSLVLGGSHSIGVPLAVSSDYSLIVPSGTMIIHPVRMNGMVIGVAQTYEYFERIQERILNFIAGNSSIQKRQAEGADAGYKQTGKRRGHSA